MSANGEAASTAAPSFEKFSFSFSKPSLLSRLNMNASAEDPESSASTGPTPAITSITDSLVHEPTTSSVASNSNTRYSSLTQPDNDAPPEEHNGIVSQVTNPGRNGPDRDSSTPRVGTPIPMEIENHEDPEIFEVMEITSSCPPGDSHIPALYRDLPAAHYLVAPPAALPYPRSPARRFPEGHPLHSQPSIFGYLPRAPPRSPRLDPLQVLELESTRERNEWEQVCNDLGRPRLERPSRTIDAPSQPQSATPTQVNGSTNKATSQAPPSDDGYDSDSSDVELRIYNADPVDEVQTPIQPGPSDALPPTPLGARPAASQLLAKPNGSAAIRSTFERLSQGTSTPKPAETTADRSGGSLQTTPAKRKIDEVDPVVQESSAKRKSPAPQQLIGVNERAGVPPPLRAEVDRIPSGAPPAPVNTEPTRVSQAPSQATVPQPVAQPVSRPIAQPVARPVAQPIAAPSTSTTQVPVVKSGQICRFHNRPPGRLCVRRDQCPDEHIGELQRSSLGAGLGPSVIEPPPPIPPVPPPVTSAPMPPVTSTPMTRTPSLADAPPLGTTPSSPPRPTRPPCRFFSKPTGCARGASCHFAHVTNEQVSRPPSRQLVPSPIAPAPTPAPIVAAPPTITPAPIPVHMGRKASFPVTADSAPAVPPTPLAAAPTLTAPVTTPIPAPQAVRTIRIVQPPQAHPLPPKPPAAVTTSPTTSPKAGTAQAKGKGKGKGKANKAGPSTTNQPGANVKAKTEPGTPVLNTKAAKRKASGSQPKPQPARLDTATREIKQEEVTLYDLVASDSPQEPSGSNVLPPEVTQSRTEVAQPQPRPIAPLPARVAPPTSATTNRTPPSTSTVLPPINRPPPPPYRPPPSSNPSTSSVPQAPPAPTPTPVAPPPPAPTVPVTSVIPPTPVRPASTTSTSNSQAASAPKASTTIAPITTTAKAPASNATPSIPAATSLNDRLTIPVPPRPNPSPAPPRPNLASESPPAQAQTQSRPRSREPPRPDSRGLARRMSPEPARRYPQRGYSREPEQRSLMTRLDDRRNSGGNSYRPPSRSRSPPRRRTPPSPRRRTPPPPRGRSRSPVRYYDRPPSPRRPLRDRFGPRPTGPPRRSRSRSWSPPRYGGRSPSRSPMYRSPSSRSSSFSRSPSRSPPRQRYAPPAPVDGYTNGSAYFPPEKNIPRSWETQASGSRPVQNQGYSSSPSDEMVIVDEPIRSSTPPPRNAIAALNDYDSFNQSRTMDISPLSSPGRGTTGGGLGNRISNRPPRADHYSPPYSPPRARNYSPEPRDGLLTRMTGPGPDLANRLAPVSNRGQAATRSAPASKPKTTTTQAQQAPLANRLAGGDPYPSQASRNDRPVRGGRLMGRMTGQ